MKSISAAAITLIAGLFLAQTSSAQTLIDFTVRYNVPGAKYEVYGRARGNVTINTGGSKIGLVLPAAAANSALAITNVAGGSWGDATQRYAPTAQPGSDFHDISTIGSLINFPNSTTEVLLFTFTHTPCLIGVRIFQPGTDAGPAAAGMAGQDYESYIENALTILDHTGVPYDNAGTICGTLPVVLTSFTGSYTGSQTDLNWVTSSEVNTSHFEIERSLNGTDFIKTGQVQATQSNGRNAQYAFTDHLLNVSSDAAYYRLKMVDKDSKYSYSKILDFRIRTSKGSIGVYPNPVTKGENIFLSINSQDNKKVSADIIDIHGKLIHRVSAAELQAKSIKTAGMSNGIYFIRININGEKTTQKIVVQ